MKKNITIEKTACQETRGLVWDLDRFTVIFVNSYK